MPTDCIKVDKTKLAEEEHLINYTLIHIFTAANILKYLPPLVPLPKPWPRLGNCLHSMPRANSANFVAKHSRVLSLRGVTYATVRFNEMGKGLGEVMRKVMGGVMGGEVMGEVMAEEETFTSPFAGVKLAQNCQFFVVVVVTGACILRL